MLLPGEFAQLGKHIVAAASFCVNLVLWNESGYFDNAAETKPLLHLWSLGVEEQFYIIWPIVLWLVFRRGRSVLWATALILFCSFVLNIAQSTSNNTADFYSPLTRFWELLIGGAIAIAWAQPAWTGSPAFLKFQRSERATSIMSLTGLFLVGASVVFVREEGFPGWQALFPVLGTALIIASGYPGPSEQDHAVIAPGGLCRQDQLPALSLALAAAFFRKDLHTISPEPGPCFAPADSLVAVVDCHISRDRASLPAKSVRAPRACLAYFRHGSACNRRLGHHAVQRLAGKDRRQEQYGPECRFRRRAFPETPKSAPS